MFSFLKVLFSLTLICVSLTLENLVPPIPHTDCPLIDDVNHAVMLPYPQDCSKYYSCSNGNAYLQQCPSNLHWSPLTYRCDYPEIAKCEIVTLNTPTQAAVAPPHLTASPTSEIIYQLLPNDCTKYYKCQAMSCPGNYHWNALTQACDFPHNAHCPFMMGLSTAVGLKQNSVPQQALNIPLTTNSNEIFAQDYPNDCSKYYQCQTMQCPASYHWNYRSQQCDLPQLAQCPWQPQLPPVTTVTNPVTVPTAFTAPPTTAIIGQTTVFTQNPLIDCPDCQHLCDGYLHQYFPHPHDCHKFIQCNGWSYIHTCPDNLYWNAVLNTCDRICVKN